MKKLALYIFFILTCGITTFGQFVDKSQTQALAGSYLEESLKNHFKVDDYTPQSKVKGVRIYSDKDSSNRTISRFIVIPERDLKNEIEQALLLSSNGNTYSVIKDDYTFRLSKLFTEDVTHNLIQELELDVVAQINEGNLFVYPYIKTKEQESGKFQFYDFDIKLLELQFITANDYYFKKRSIISPNGDTNYYSCLIKQVNKSGKTEMYHVAWAIWYKEKELVASINVQKI